MSISKDRTNQVFAPPSVRGAKDWKNTSSAQGTETAGLLGKCGPEKSGDINCARH